MAEDVRVTNLPESGSVHRVAYDLMVRITAAEHRGKDNPNNRAYYLKLYGECLSAVKAEQGYDLAALL